MEGLTEDVTRELLRAKSLASLGCALHTRRALVALRRSRPLDAKVNHNIVMLTNMPFSKPVVTGFGYSAVVFIDWAVPGRARHLAAPEGMPARAIVDQASIKSHDDHGK